MTLELNQYRASVGLYYAKCHNKFVSKKRINIFQFDKSTFSDMVTIFLTNIQAATVILTLTFLQSNYTKGNITIVILLLILLSMDVHPNPGYNAKAPTTANSNKPRPRYRFPCKKCESNE